MFLIENQYCFESPARRASQEECEKVYIRTAEGFVPCVYDSPASKCTKAKVPPMTCPDLKVVVQVPQPSPPAASPSPPPRTRLPNDVPPHGSATEVADVINERFRREFRHVNRAGVIMHSFDGWEDPSAPWSPCPEKGGAGVCGRAEIQPRRDRVSASIIYQGMHRPDRPDRSVIPVFSFDGGVILRPDRTTILCAYGNDGAIDYGGKNCRITGATRSPSCVPGCGDPPNWCDPNEGLIDGWCNCGFEWCGSVRPRPWHPKDLPKLIEKHAFLGSKYTGMGTYTGYNEVVIDSSSWVETLPGIIEAFFYFDGCAPGQANTPLSSQLPRDGSRPKDCVGAASFVRTKHQDFLKRFNLAAHDVPLLRFRQTDWTTPFSVEGGTRREAAAPSSSPPARVPTGSAACSSPWCRTFESWLDDTDSKFYSLWGGAWQKRMPKSGGCWDWQSTASFFEDTLAGKRCDRNWLEGEMGSRSDRLFRSPSPALLGFDETIVELCSRLIGADPWGGQDKLDFRVADRCLRARRNVLRLMTGGWTMCQNLEWQLCALTGRLPGQGGKQVAFATAPKDLRLQWWEDPATHPTWPCNGERCDPNRFTVGDVFYAEVMIAYTVCANRARLFELDQGELFECDVSEDAYRGFVERLRSS